MDINIANPGSLFGFMRGARRLASALLAVGFFTITVSPELWAIPPKVVATIKPIHALAATIMEGVGAPELLIAGAVSHHDFALRPSMMRRLHEADLILWVGPVLESGLVAVLSGPALESKSITLAALPDLTKRYLFPAKTEQHADQSLRDNIGLDPHLWLDPANALLILREISIALGRIDPANRDLYEQNRARAAVRLEQQDIAIADGFSGRRPVAYLVFHDAYGYFEARYGLTPVAAVTSATGRPPGAAWLGALRRLMGARDVRCVVVEPGNRPSLLPNLIAGYDPRVVEIDPIGIYLEPGPDLFFTLLADMAAGFARCAVE